MPEDCEPKPGWYAQLSGSETDLEDWRLLCKKPYDPVAVKLPGGETALRSSMFDDLESAQEVRERSLVLIGRLNGGLRLCRKTGPVTFNGVRRVHAGGQIDSYIFPGTATADMIRFKLRADMKLLGPDGLPMEIPAAEPSPPQAWNALAAQNDDLSDLLDHFGRADNWYDIYKTIEFAEHVIGSERKLARLLGADAKVAKQLKTSANFFRHAKAYRPPNLMDVEDAARQLAQIVRSVIASIR